MRASTRIWLFIAIMILNVSLPGLTGTAQAACTYPDGNEGDLLYNDEHRALQYCDGLSWHAAPKADAPPADGLIAHWTFGDGSGTAVTDNIGGHDGSFVDTPVWNTGLIGGAVSFPEDGGNHYVEVPHDAALEPDDITVSIWVYHDGTQEDYAELLVKGNYFTGDDCSSYSYGFERDRHNDRYKWDVCHSGDSTRILSDTIPDNTWVHLVGTYNSETQEIAIYQNTALQDSRIETGTRGSNTKPIVFGCYGGGNCSGAGRMRGKIDDARIYDRVLDAAEIQALYNHGAASLADPCNPVNAPSPGQVCTDGTIYAGNIGAGPLYVADVNQDSGGAPWKIDEGENDIVDDSDYDGVHNQSQVSPLSEFPAFELCSTLNRHGHDDWYLPATYELEELYNNKAAIDASSAENFNNFPHWSSRELSTGSARNIDFTDGTFRMNSKSGDYNVRCVRRGYQSPCENPFGLPGDVLYNSDHDVLQYCAAGQWHATGPVPGNGGAGCSLPDGDAGDLVYNSDDHVIQYCDGSLWQAMGAVPDCPVTGDQCADGSYFIGISPEDGKKVYMTSAAHELTDSQTWDEDPPCYQCGLNDTGATSYTDGRANVEALRAYSGDSATAGTLDGFGAAKYCDNLVAHGHNDWYLIAAGEEGMTDTEGWLLRQLYIDRGFVGGLNNTDMYWSSTERDTQYARGIYIDVRQHYHSKQNPRSVRCVRR